jgi:hypothetical protein
MRHWVFLAQSNRPKYLLKFSDLAFAWDGIFVADKICHSLTISLLIGIHTFTFALPPWLLIHCGGAGHVVEAIQVRGVNQCDSGKAEAIIDVGGTYLENLATDHRAVTV